MEDDNVIEMAEQTPGVFAAASEVGGCTSRHTDPSLPEVGHPDTWPVCQLAAGVQSHADIAQANDWPWPVHMAIDAQGNAFCWGVA